jgi:hypothetical protein
MRSFCRPLLFLALFVPIEAHSQDASDFKGDKTGTNPVNFTFDARIYNEFLWLNTEGDGDRNVTTVEYRQPLLDGKLQFRTRIRVAGVQADVTGNGRDDLESFGLGEIDFRFLSVPYIDMKKRRAIAVGFETFLPTGNSAVGSERASFGPQLFGVFFAPFGIKGTLIAPAYQHKFSFYEEGDVRGLHQGLVDLFLLWASADKQYWALLDPQFVPDYRNETEFGLFDAELGMMLDRYLETKGLSVYLRPSVGIGAHRPSDASIEWGAKFVW